jgi:hypothetical protein
VKVPKNTPKVVLKQPTFKADDEQVSANISQEQTKKLLISSNTNQTPTPKNIFKNKLNKNTIPLKNNNEELNESKKSESIRRKTEMTSPINTTTSRNTFNNINFNNISISDNHIPINEPLLSTSNSRGTNDVSIEETRILKSMQDIEYEESKNRDLAKKQKALEDMKREQEVIANQLIEKVYSNYIFNTHIYDLI